MFSCLGCLWNDGMYPLVVDFLSEFYGRHRTWFWACVVFIVFGLIAIAANLMM